MDLSVLGLASLSDEGVSGGRRLARLVLGDGIVTGVAPFGWRLRV